MEEDTEISITYSTVSQKLSYTNIDSKTCKVTGVGKCQDTNIVIPEEYNGRMVTEIRESAFRNNTKIESVTISRNIDILGQYSFSGCTNLKKITIYSDNLEEIGKENFIGNVSFEEFEVNSENRNYKTIDGILFSKDDTKIIRYPQGKKDKEYTIPTTVKEICIRAIDQNQYLEKLTILDNVESVGDYAVALLPKLNTLIVNAKTFNGIGAFCENYYCTNIEIGSNVKEFLRRRK